MSKRGLSNLVATVLIVLLALAAVAIVWGFLKPAFDRTGQLTGLRSQCFTVDVQPISCTYNNNTNATLSVRVMTESDGLSEVAAVFELADETTTTSREGVPGVLETVSITSGDFTDPSTEVPVKARVAAVVSDGTAQEICPESTTINCVDVTP